MMISKYHARYLRSLIEKVSQFLSDEDALKGEELFPYWEIGKTYNTNDRFRYNDKLYKVVQAHTSQENWTPDIVPALYTEVALPGEIPVWKQPTGAHDTYQTGDKVWFPEKDTTIYISTVDNNSWAPNVYGWEVFSN